ncbi:response regulator [Myxococcus sp. CA051A]|uniref:Response regulator n=1 Tax=Myxococcus llanfairpwllgwyngyllgogerychwyrndrobwllllantysiliogogogochensis TaxID=2590453 RepID=A0A540X5H6_9BACT|nr:MULTISPECIES: response regulator [Myxococcus]NTX06501.1 response regulator [Myxococcus sp. CA040A]NTX09757.1 response regulator [Myxococcus sp. CA056]NTX35117.1 response regulator [Myxococcus sp. CA033]NTX50549.1 response regulator [Myxococcus sp. CA039A]NTX65084.1 response regulator [Myxococcus sp. CA051A]
MSEMKIRVLVVDDDQEQLTLAERSLSAFGFDVRTHRSSLGVSNLVRTTLPDLVLLDVNIPALTGDKVLTLARGQAPAGTRFVLFSASDESKLRALALASGADGYITKSTQGEELAKKLHAIYAKGRAVVAAPAP